MGCPNSLYALAIVVPKLYLQSTSHGEPSTCAGMPGELQRPDKGHCKAWFQWKVSSEHGKGPLSFAKASARRLSKSCVINDKRIYIYICFCIMTP